MNVFDSTESKILVTGGAGFIGSALIWDLNQRGVDDVLVADFLGTDEKWRNLAPLRFHDYLEADDLLHRVEADDPALSEIELVFHLGACSATTEHDAAYLIRNNFEYTKTLARWALAHDARFVYASSRGYLRRRRARHERSGARPRRLPAAETCTVIPSISSTSTRRGTGFSTASWV